MVRIAVYLSLWSIAFQTNDRVWADEPGDERVRFLISCLDKRVSVSDEGGPRVPYFLDALTKAASEPGFEKDAKKRCSIVLDGGGFLKASGGMFDFERETTRFGTGFKNVRLETALERLCSQMTSPGVIFVRNDALEIVPRSEACKKLGITLDEDEPMPRLVYRIFKSSPLDQVLQEIAERYNQNIVIAPQADSKKSTAITARLVNVPINIAVETVAELADLKVIRRPNLLYVTTKEQAAELQREQPKKK